MLKTRAMVFLLVSGLGLWQLGSGLWIHAKAQLAQVLLEHAWSRTLAGENQVRPWPWADTWPLARLRIPSRNLDVIVLQGDSGRSLAFGPGLAPGSFNPGRAGTTLISAHRDTHFRGLAGIQVGELIELETVAGRWSYRTAGTQVIDARKEGIANDPLNDQLVLLTCYPFESLTPRGPLRFAVYALATSV